MHYSNTLVSVQIKFDYETPPDKVHFSDLEHALVNQHLMSRLSIFYKTDRKAQKMPLLRSPLPFATVIGGLVCYWLVSSSGLV